jgi:hypothetical protein
MASTHPGVAPRSSTILGELSLDSSGFSAAFFSHKISQQSTAGFSKKFYGPQLLPWLCVDELGGNRGVGIAARIKDGVKCRESSAEEHRASPPPGFSQAA